MVHSPISSFTIPSIHDDTPLECRLYHPSRFTVTKESWRKKGAIVAHPYAPLGGCYDDPVVQVAVAEILKKGFVVGTFNLRGAGASKGSTSWTAKPELSDYISFVGFFIYYLHGLNPNMAKSSTENSRPGDGSPLSPIQSTTQQYPNSMDLGTPSMILILGGYSYGSLLTLSLPSIEAIISHFDTVAQGTAEAEVRLRALNLTHQWNAEARQTRNRGRSLTVDDAVQRHSQTVSVGGEESEPGTRKSRESGRSIDVVRRSMDRSRVKLRIRKSSRSGTPPSPPLEVKLASGSIVPPQTCYLLISPLLPPISSFATMFSKLGVSGKGYHHSSRHESTSQTLHSEDQKLLKHPALAVYGDKDFFTSQRKLRKWAQHLKDTPGSQFTFSEIAGAGHFWHEEGVEGQLKGVIRSWIVDIENRRVSG